MKKVLLLVLLWLLPAPVFAQNPVTVAPMEGTPADAESNTEPFLGRIGTRGYFFNGTTWDRMRGDTTNGLWVNIKNPATFPVSGTVTANMGTVTADPFGANADAASATGSISAKLRFIASTGIPITGTVTVGSHNVTNAGTFATQSAITAASGSIASGAVSSGAIASGAYASGAIGSGAVASGAFASGAIGSGAIASGAIASGAIASGAIASGAVASGAYGSDSGSFGVGSTGSAPPAKGVFNAGIGSGATGGLLLGIAVADTVKGINVSTATTTLMVTGVSGRHVRVTAFHMIAAGADNVQWISGTGATCGTGTTGIGGGGTSAGSGYNFAANGGIAMGNGLGVLFTTTSTGDSLCLVTSAAVQLSGMITYTIY